MDGEPTLYPKKYAHGFCFCFAVLCCGYTLTDFPISIRLTSLALWQLSDCHSASKATLMNMDKYFMWIHYERLHNHNKAKHNKTVCIFLGIYCTDKKIKRTISTMRPKHNDILLTALSNVFSQKTLQFCLNTVHMASFGTNKLCSWDIQDVLQICHQLGRYPPLDEQLNHLIRETHKCVSNLDRHWCRWWLVAEPLSVPMLTHSQLSLREQHLKKYQSNTNVFIAAILSRPQCAKFKALLTLLSWHIQIRYIHSAWDYGMKTFMKSHPYSIQA